VAGHRQLNSVENQIRANLRRHKERVAVTEKLDKAYRKNDHRFEEAKKRQERKIEEQVGKDQTKMITLDRIQGMTTAQIAEKYRIHPATVNKRLGFAQRMKIIDHHVESVIGELVPKALGVYDLTMSDLYHEVNPQVINVANRVLEGSGVLRRDGTALDPRPGDPGEISTIEEYRAWRITKRNPVEERDHEDLEYGTGGGGTVLDAHQEDPGGDLDGDLSQLPEDRDGGSQDPAGGDPEDQGCG